MVKAFGWLAAALLLFCAASGAGAATLARVEHPPLVLDRLPAIAPSPVLPPVSAPASAELATEITEIPEPASLLLLSSGLFGLALLGQRQVI